MLKNVSNDVLMSKKFLKNLSLPSGYKNQCHNNHNQPFLLYEEGDAEFYVRNKWKNYETGVKCL